MLSLRTHKLLYADSPTRWTRTVRSFGRKPRRACPLDATALVRGMREMLLERSKIRRSARFTRSSSGDRGAREAMQPSTRPRCCGDENHMDLAMTRDRIAIRRVVLAPVLVSSLRCRTDP